MKVCEYLLGPALMSKHSKEHFIITNFMVTVYLLMRKAGGKVKNHQFVSKIFYLRLEVCTLRYCGSFEGEWKEGKRHGKQTKYWNGNGWISNRYYENDICKSMTQVDR